MTLTIPPFDYAQCSETGPVRERNEDKTAVLGLVTTKTPVLETVSALEARVREASQFIPLERLAVSPQCGFSTSIVGNRLSISNQKKKLGLVVETANRVWED